MLEGFKKFILRGNVIDLAVGVVVGSAFNVLVNALVKDLLTPFISAVLRAPDFSDLYFKIHGSRFMYGEFFNSLLAFFIIVATVYFFVVTPLNVLIRRMKKEPPEEIAKKRCPECLSEIPKKATRCAFCTAKLHG